MFLFSTGAICKYVIGTTIKGTSKRKTHSGKSFFPGGIAILLLVSLSASHQSVASPDQYSIEEIYQQLDRHPSISAMHQQVEAISELKKTSGSLPDPSLIAGIDNLPLDNFSFDDYLPTSKVLGIRQAFPKRGETEVMSERYSADLNLAELKVEQQKAKLRADFLDASLSAWLAEEQTKLISLSLNSMTELSEQYEVQAAQGDAVDAHILHIKREQIALNRELKKQALHREQAHLKVQSLLGHLHRVSFSELSEAVGEFGSLAKTTFYGVEQARLEIDQAQSYVARAELDFDPSFSVQALYKQRESSRNFDGDDWLSVQASVSIPLWSSTRQVPQANAAKRQRQSAESRLDAAVLNWHERFKSAVEESRWMSEELSLIRDQKMLMDEQAIAQERLYESLESDWVSVLELKLRSLSLQREYNEVETKRLKHINEFKRNIIAQTRVSKGANDR